jgi:TRAP-type mannitol/chloroaromatic compound transport system substrate-binding protein
MKNRVRKNNYSSYTVEAKETDIFVYSRYKLSKEEIESFEASLTPEDIEDIYFVDVGLDMEKLNRHALRTEIENAKEAKAIYESQEAFVDHLYEWQDSSELQAKFPTFEEYEEYCREN